VEHISKLITDIANDPRDLVEIVRQFGRRTFLTE
jgi:hypothetical protein